MSYIPSSVNLPLGFCFGTVLMRSALKEVYYNSISYSVSKNHFYLVSVGNQIDEEMFWIKGRELFTLYTNTQGFQVLRNSSLEEDIESKISEDDYSTWCRFSDSHIYRDLTKDYPFSVVRTLPNLYSSLDSCISTLKSLWKEITVYSIQTKNKPYYLEEIRHYVNPSN